MLTITKGYTWLLYVGLTNSTNANVGPCILNYVGRGTLSHVRLHQCGVVHHCGRFLSNSINSVGLITIICFITWGLTLYVYLPTWGFVY